MRPVWARGGARLFPVGLLCYSLAQLGGQVWGEGDPVCFFKGLGCGIGAVGVAALLRRGLGAKGDME